LGTIAGPIVGAIVIIALENKLGDLGNLLAALTGVEWFRSIGESVTIVTGFIFIVCVLAFRRGIVGEIGALLKRPKAAAQTTPSATSVHAAVARTSEG
jgi:branched-chain amino acid transport system permease protein